MNRLTRKMSCKIKEKNRMSSFERNCGKQSWYVFGISTLRQKNVQPACCTVVVPDQSCYK